MSLECGLPLLECFYCLGCVVGVEAVRPPGYHNNATDFAPVRRMCRLMMANYEPDIAAPLLDPSNVVHRRTYTNVGGRVTPYLLYLDLGRSGASTSAACSWSLACAYG
ncbi:hypothetical protein ZWY2020_040434 [Hordeum vulgare]|nr:hypothetical protein ZWY2020_040434 [Hordeum vulgare]